MLAAAIGIVTYATDAFRGIELDTMDTRFSIRGDQVPPDDVVVVEIDDVTFSRLDEQWPFPRSLHGELIDRLDRRRGAGDRLRRPVHRADDAAPRTTP